MGLWCRLTLITFPVPNKVTVDILRQRRDPESFNSVTSFLISIPVTLGSVEYLRPVLPLKQIFVLFYFVVDLSSVFPSIEGIPFYTNYICNVLVLKLTSFLETF